MSAFVSGSEIAYFGLTPQEIEELEESQDDEHKNKAQRIDYKEIDQKIFHKKPFRRDEL